jgi:hypothetical protein
MASSETEICNMALTRLGHDVISALDEGSVTADLCNLFYATTRDSLLRAHLWNFSIKRVDLASTDAEPAFGYTYEFPLPSDCLRVLRTESEEEGVNAEYRIERRVNGEATAVYTDDDTCAIEYVSRVTDVAQFDPLFTDALVLLLANKMAYKLTQNGALLKELRDETDAVLRVARTVDSMEGTPRDLQADGWALERM